MIRIEASAICSHGMCVGMPANPCSDTNSVGTVVVFGRGETLLRFFAIYYAATSLLTFVLQTSSSRLALEKLGLAVSAGTPSFALLAGSIGGLIELDYLVEDRVGGGKFFWG